MTPLIFCAANATLTDPFGGFQVSLAAILMGHGYGLFLSSPETHHSKHSEGENPLIPYAVEPSFREYTNFPPSVSLSTIPFSLRYLR